MGRDARRTHKTIDEHTQNPDLPDRLKFFLRHPTFACVCIALGFPIDILRGAYVGARNTTIEFTHAWRTFYALARGRDV